MVALADALATLAPAQKPIAIAWPDAIHVDGGLIGGGRLAWPDGADAAEPPPWLVFGAMIRTVSMAADGSGPRLLANALDDDGFGDDGADRLVESFARHFMRVIDRWRESGFTAIATNFVSRLAPKQGVRYGIGDHGELLVTRVGKAVEYHSLQPTLAVPSWLDLRSGGPRG
jgi:hypothetical protein